MGGWHWMNVDDVLKSQNNSCIFIPLSFALSSTYTVINEYIVSKEGQPSFGLYVGTLSKNFKRKLEQSLVALLQIRPCRCRRRPPPYPPRPHIIRRGCVGLLPPRRLT
jgi:hypothetical protein